MQFYHKIYYSLVILLSLSSCQKEKFGAMIPADYGEVSERTFSADCGGEKTALSGMKVNWVEGDVISVYDLAGNTASYTVTAEDIAKDPARVSFKLSLANPPYYAACGGKTSFDKESATFDVSVNPDGSFGKAGVIVASSTTSSLSFKHVFSYMHFTCTKPDIEAVHIAMDQLGFAEAGVSFTEPGGEINVQKKGFCDWCINSNGNNFYIPLVCGTYYKFSFVVKTSSGAYYLENSTQLSASSGHIVEMGDITSRLTPMYFYESFDNYTTSGGANDGNFATRTESEEVSLNDNDGWNLSNARFSYRSMSLGLDSALGVATTPALGRTPSETAVLLKFRAAGWDADTETGRTLKLSITGGGSLSRTEVEMTRGMWTDFVVGITGATSSTKITFEGTTASKSRFYIDEVMVVPPTTVETSSTLTSGSAILSSLNSGLAPLSFSLSTNTKVIGAVKNGKNYDLFFNCVDGAPSQWWGKSGAGCNVCSYVGNDADGNPIYTNPIPVSAPFGFGTSHTRVTTIADNTMAFYIVGSKMKVASYNATNHTFTATGTEFDLSTLTLPIMGFDVLETESGVAYTAFVTNSVADNIVYPALDRDEAKYYSDGKYKGQVPSANIYKMKINTTKWSAGTIVSVAANVMLAPTGIATYKTDCCNGYVLCNQFGALKYVSKSGVVENLYTNGPDDTLTEPAENPSAATNIVVAGKDLVVSGEGAIQYFKVLDGAWTSGAGGPKMNPGGPQPVRTRTAPLYAGNICVPDIVDMDADGLLDIIAGTSEGRILFFKNSGTNRNPVFGIPEALTSNGRELLIRPGYYTVNGPMEAARGYVCPAVFDWNNDGLQDIIFTSAEGKVEVMLNVGTATAPSFGRRTTLMQDGVELYGMWRSRPALMTNANGTYIAIVDYRSQIHLYMKEANFNVRDQISSYTQNVPSAELPTVLLNATEAAITTYRSNYASKNEWGRASLQFFDWDMDGNLDIIVSTSSDGCVPAADKGLPASRGANGLNVMWLRNEGNNLNFKKMGYPKQFIFKGMDFYLGDMPCYAVASRMGAVLNDKPNLFVGAPDGRIYYFENKDLQETTLW